MCNWNGSFRFVVGAVTALVCVGITTLAHAGENECAKTFTAEVAGRVLSGPVVAAERNSKDDLKNGPTIVSQCGYSAKQGSDDITIGVTLRKAGTAEEAKSIFLGSKKTYNGQDVSNLGDMAYRTAAPAQLNVLHESTWLVISAGKFPTPDTALQEKAAREILKNIRD
jgi:hypothetical protein